MQIETDFLVIGSGIAGLSFALKAAQHGRVIVITKKAKMDTNTNLAQGGIAAVSASDDNFDLHIADTLRSGDGLCHPEIVELVVKQAPERIRELIELGVHFTTRTDNPKQYDLGREGGHARRRILHARDLTGQEIERALIDAVMTSPNIALYENHSAVDLITKGKLLKGKGKSNQETCFGAYVLDTTTGIIHTFLAGITLLCTGGAGKVYLYTSNPDIATGDGIAMAYRAGAKIADMEFVQFHPTCLYHPRAKNFLITEAVRGEGGVLVDDHGRTFMEKYDPMKDLATRDIVARAIDTELKKSGSDCVYLDITHRDPDFIRNRFPNIYNKCLAFGIDITREPIPVVPAAHYICGGALTDIYARTSTRRLYAIGETACTGLHGANRLASNSLLEAVVFAHQGATKAAEEAKEGLLYPTSSVPAWDTGGAIDMQESVLISHNWDELRRLMWNYVGIVRTDKRLALAKTRLEFIQQEIQQHYWDYIITADFIELRNLATVAELIITSAILRKESRGLHHNVDHPLKDDLHFNKDTVIWRG
ncbi:MAG: L-aspartate oxidase [Pseudomonadota bacterium]